MSQPPRQLQVSVWGGLALIVIGLVIIYSSKPETKPLPVLGAMTDFSLTNQDGKMTSLQDLKGKVWVGDAIFTRCPGECLEMSTHMKSIQDLLPAGSAIQLVSMSTDPDFDSPPVLKKYAEHFKADPTRWIFLTGDKTALHAAEVDGLKLAVMEKPADQKTAPNDLFIHSEKFALVDKQGRLRAWFDGEKPETPAAVAAAAQQLAQE